MRQENDKIPQVTTDEQAKQIIDPNLEQKGTLIDNANAHIRLVWRLAKAGVDMSEQQDRIRAICERKKPHDVV